MLFRRNAFTFQIFTYKIIYCKATTAMISSLIKSNLEPARFSCSNTFNLTHSSLGSHDENLVFEIPQADTIIIGDLSNFISMRSRVDLIPTAFISTYVSFAESYHKFSSNKLSRLTL